MIRSNVMARKLSHPTTAAHRARRHVASVVPDRARACACLLSATFALSACGGGAHSGSSASTQPDPSSEPNAIVATVAGHAITKAAYAHWFRAEEGEGANVVAPVPPDFSACVKRLRQIAAQSGASGEKMSAAALKDECRQQYQKLQTLALERLIDAQWVIGGAAEEGVGVSERELEQELKKAEGKESQAQVERQLARSGRTMADVMLQVKVQALGEAIRHALAKRTAHPTQAQVARFYEENKSAYGLPKRRDLEIAHAESESEAQAIKREIAAGKTFASVVVKRRLSQPIYAGNGSLMSYEPGLYSQRPLDHAIFAAKPNVLSGPVRIELGYYVFVVRRVYPPVQKPLAQVAASIRRELPNVLYHRALATFVKEWRKRWTARTDCRPGYVVAKCRQFTPSPTALEREQEDPFTL
jgi:foldase protein PrsA